MPDIPIPINLDADPANPETMLVTVEPSAYLEQGGQRQPLRACQFSVWENRGNNAIGQLEKGEDPFHGMDAGWPAFLFRDPQGVTTNVVLKLSIPDNVLQTYAGREIFVSILIFFMNEEEEVVKERKGKNKFTRNTGGWFRPRSKSTVQHRHLMSPAREITIKLQVNGLLALYGGRDPARAGGQDALPPDAQQAPAQASIALHFFTCPPGGNPDDASHYALSDQLLSVSYSVTAGGRTDQQRVDVRDGYLVIEPPGRTGECQLSVDDWRILAFRRVGGAITPVGPTDAWSFGFDLEIPHEMAVFLARHEPSPGEDTGPPSPPLTEPVVTPPPRYEDVELHRWE